MVRVMHHLQAILQEGFSEHSLAQLTLNSSGQLQQVEECMRLQASYMKGLDFSVHSSAHVNPVLLSQRTCLEHSPSDDGQRVALVVVKNFNAASKTGSQLLSGGCKSLAAADIATQWRFRQGQCRILLFLHLR